jgi:hypothetical protein
MAQNTQKQEAAQDVAPETVIEVDETADVAETSQGTDVAAQASKTGPNGEPVDNQLVQDAGSLDEPAEMPDSELPPEISPGHMGAPRAQLMLLLGLDATHPFDGEAEAKLREVLPEYNGTVTKEMWRKLHRADHLVSGSKE